MEKKNLFAKDVVKNPGVLYVSDEYDWAIGLDSKRMLLFVYEEDEVLVVYIDPDVYADEYMWRLPNEAEYKDWKHIVTKHIFEKWA